MEDKDLLYLFRATPSISQETHNILAHYAIVVPSHKHEWKRRKRYLDSGDARGGTRERRCFYSWKLKDRRYSCYATYVYIEKLKAWNYCESGAVIVLKKFPGWYEVRGVV